MRRQGYYRAAKDGSGSKKNVRFKKSKLFSLVFYYCPDKCVSLVLLARRKEGTMVVGESCSALYY